MADEEGGDVGRALLAQQSFSTKHGKAKVEKELEL